MYAKSLCFTALHISFTYLCFMIQYTYEFKKRLIKTAVYNQVKSHYVVEGYLMHDKHIHSHDHHHHHHEDTYTVTHTIAQELMHHLPYAIFSVAFALLILSFYSAFSIDINGAIVKKGSKALFHSFHFMHLVFAATGTIITFRRFSKNVFKALVVGIVSPTVFCILSDAVLPYLGGTLLGVTMRFHACFLTEPFSVIPFLAVGIVNGFVMSTHHGSRQGNYSLSSHAVHILVSSLASTFYLISHGFTNWYSSIGNIFLLLIVAVVVPCTLADVVVPMTVARGVRGKDAQKHTI